MCSSIVLMVDLKEANFKKERACLSLYVLVLKIHVIQVSRLIFTTKAGIVQARAKVT